MDLFSMAGVAVWFFGVSIVGAGVLLGILGARLLRELNDAVEMSWIKTKLWWRR